MYIIKVNGIYLAHINRTYNQVKSMQLTSDKRDATRFPREEDARSVVNTLNANNYLAYTLPVRSR